MSVRCIDCAHLDMQKHPKHSALGFAPCKLEKMPGVMVSMVYPRECPSFKDAEPGRAAARMDWLNSKEPRCIGCKRLQGNGHEAGCAVERGEVLMYQLSKRDEK